MEFVIFFTQLLLIALLIIATGCALAFVLAMSTAEGRREFKSFRARRIIKRKMKNMDWARMVSYCEEDVRATLAMYPSRNNTIFDDCVAYHGFNPLTTITETP